MPAHLRLLAALTALAAVALTAACGISFEGGAPEDPAPASTAPTIPAPTLSPPPGTPSPSLPPSPSAPSTPAETAPPAAVLPAGLRDRPAVAAAIADTAQREKVAPQEVVVAAWSPVTWSDGSLGCPQEGMSYTQATVDGELLILRVDGGLFQYHGRTGGPFTYCADPSAGYAVG